MYRRDFLKGFIAATSVALVPLPTITEVPISTVSFDSLVATTLKSYREVMAQNIFRKDAVWFILKRKKLVRELDEQYGT